MDFNDVEFLSHSVKEVVMNPDFVLDNLSTLHGFVVYKWLREIWWWELVVNVLKNILKKGCSSNTSQLHPILLVWSENTWASTFYVIMKACCIQIARWTWSVDFTTHHSTLTLGYATYMGTTPTIDPTCHKLGLYHHANLNRSKFNIDSNSSLETTVVTYRSPTL